MLRLTPSERRPAVNVLVPLLHRAFHRVHDETQEESFVIGVGAVFRHDHPIGASDFENLGPNLAQGMEDPSPSAAVALLVHGVVIVAEDGLVGRVGGLEEALSVEGNGKMEKPAGTCHAKETPEARNEL